MARDILSHLIDIKQTANELFDIWKHAGGDECYEQIEAHLESSRFNGHDIVICLDDMRNKFDAQFGI